MTRRPSPTHSPSPLSPWTPAHRFGCCPDPEPDAPPWGDLRGPGHTQSERLGRRWQSACQSGLLSDTAGTRTGRWLRCATAGDWTGSAPPGSEVTSRPESRAGRDGVREPPTESDTWDVHSPPLGFWAEGRPRPPMPSSVTPEALTVTASGHRVVRGSVIPRKAGGTWPEGAGSRAPRLTVPQAPVEGP